MSQFGSFVLGGLVGGALVFGSLKHHVLRTDNGFTTVPKLSAEFGETYVDIREFGAAEWAEHKGLLAAIIHAKKGDLVADSAMDDARGHVDQFLERLDGLLPEPREQ